ncbi:hypothetical protein [Spirosoma fluminis]
MKSVLTNLFLLFVMAGCQQPVHPKKDDSADLQHTNKMSQAQQWFDGQWQLTAVTAMVSNATVPNVRLVVALHQKRT